MQSFFLSHTEGLASFAFVSCYLVELEVLISIRTAAIVPSVGQGTVPHDTMAGHSQAIVPAAHAARIIR